MEQKARIVFNRVSIQEAIEYYLNNVVFRENQNITVTFFNKKSEGISGTEEYEVTFENKKEQETK